MTENSDRKLAVILAADVVDYSRLVAKDEEGTVRAFQALRETIVDPIIEKFGGRIANTAGDSLLGRVDKRDSQAALNVIQAGICDGDQL
ncbi:adenylate/guanylate cyclase domain-containing protein, partial [Ruegeria sp. XHP0148]|nr:adenylate/guanylate cyclase domain-containing protein [Ruegeria sp. XHP0148]